MAESITLTSVRKEFGDTVAMSDVSLTIEPGETLGIVGPSGCGKTTTLRTVAGFETPSQGRVLFGEDDVTTVPPEQRDVGLVFQSYALFENMTVRENVEFGLKMRDVPADERRARATRLLQMLDIGTMADRDPATLSGGQQQRVGLARALAIEPRVLLLDEPMTGLDAQLKTRLQEEIGSLLDSIDVTSLYVTHDQSEAMVMCDRIAVMNEGSLEQVGSPDELYERPANDFVAQFIGTANRLSGDVTGTTLSVAGAEFTTTRDLPDGNVTVIARPEAFSLGDGPVNAEIVEHHYLGGHVRATAETDSGEELVLEIDPPSMPTTPDIQLDIDTTRLHVLES
ncbi:ABC transporter ATP-binding protein [Halorubrum ezzemoulense]|uniref:ABC transporter ATP-binding protein n=1 Tax=Halorubrum ezzemoulense TaxID=337243 RepID=UPI00232F58C5|nr:ABC transporter ATP-binding protein [Halorubrum ezzemoulense]MDB2276418.1 ABC transporter ATP-binding protein [Halorubrum ezzemoulense]